MGLSTKQVSSDVQDWNQGDLLQSPSADSGGGSSMESPKPLTKRQQEPNPQPPAEKLKCPRCDSANTKFCYYNNYNKSQPRYFCKACKRHWTKGGMLRNVPVGGGRKNKRIRTSGNTTTSATKAAASANISVLAASLCAKNSHPRVVAHGSDQRISLPLGSGDENTTRKMLSQAILGPQSLIQGSLFNSNMDFSIGKNSSNESNFNGIFGGSSVLSIPQNHDLKFPYPSFSSSDYNFPCSVSACGQIPNLFGLNNGGESSNNALDETAMTSFDTSLSCSSLNDKPWPSYESTSNWDWDDMDKFAISDVTIPWDDAEIN